MGGRVLYLAGGLLMRKCCLSCMKGMEGGGSVVLLEKGKKELRGVMFLSGKSMDSSSVVFLVGAGAGGRFLFLAGGREWCVSCGKETWRVAVLCLLWNMQGERVSFLVERSME